MTIDWGAVSIIVLVLRFGWDFIKERREQPSKIRLADIQSKEAEERIRKSLESSMLAENQRLTDENTRLNERVIELEGIIKSVQDQIAQDIALRETAIKTLTARVSVLESERVELQQRIAALEDELGKRDARIKELEANQRSVGQGGMLAR